MLESPVVSVAALVSSELSAAVSAGVSPAAPVSSDSAGASVGASVGAASAVVEAAPPQAERLKARAAKRKESCFFMACHRPFLVWFRYGLIIGAEAAGVKYLFFIVCHTKNGYPCHTPNQQPVP